MYILFHHLPKTAGRSITNWLATEGQWPSAINKHPSSDWYKEISQGRGILLNEPPKLSNGANSSIPVKVLGGHRTWSGLSDIFGWDVWEEFTILREPAERLYSHYKHEANKNLVKQSFEHWGGGRAIHPVCHCMWCFSGQGGHKTNPIAWFYASKIVGPPPDDPLEQARKVLTNCRVYQMTKLYQCVLDMACCLEIDPTTYKSMYITGHGQEITEEQRSMVAETHPLDYILWEEFGG